MTDAIKRTMTKVEDIRVAKMGVGSKINHSNFLIKVKY